MYRPTKIHLGFAHIRVYSRGSIYWSLCEHAKLYESFFIDFNVFPLFLIILQYFILPYHIQIGQSYCIVSVTSHSILCVECQYRCIIITNAQYCSSIWQHRLKEKMKKVHLKTKRTNLVVSHTQPIGGVLSHFHLAVVYVMFLHCLI